jgi:ABC-2 type transport system ATP-binding protein
MNAAPALLIEGLTRSFGPVRAVDGVSLRVEPGEFVGFCGHNGAGKTTTLRVLTGQLTRDEGRVEILGLDVEKEPRRCRGLVGYVPENPALYDYLSAREFITFVAEIRAEASGGVVKAGSITDRVEEALELAELGEDADRLIREYSQGMRRRAALAAAMVSHPPVLLLDEALNGLDPPSARRVREALRARCREGAAVLLSTHVLETLERYADRVVMLAHGRVVGDLRVSEAGPGGLEAFFLERMAAGGEAS